MSLDETREDSVTEETETHASPRDHGLAAAIYGQVLTTATVAAVAFDENLRAIDTLATVLASVVVLWVAHIYAESLGHGGGLRQARVVLAEFRWPIVETAVPTLVVLTLAAVGVISSSIAVTVSEIIGAAGLMVLGMVVARRAGASVVRAVIFAASSAVFGLVIVIVKTAVH